MSEEQSETVFRDWPTQADKRVNAFIGYCPHCPLDEGTATHVRLEEIARIARRCPKCGRIYVVI